MKTRTKTRTIPKTPFFAAFSVGAVLFSAHAGGGFATGNQANTYYVGLGWAGIVSAIVAMLLLINHRLRDDAIPVQQRLDQCECPFGLVGVFGFSLPDYGGPQTS